jgi:hypothetical protein
VRRVSTGSLLAGAAYAALLEDAHELQSAGKAPSAGVPRETLRDAFG